MKKNGLFLKTALMMSMVVPLAGFAQDPQTYQGDAINIEGYQQEEMPVTDGELQQVDAELQRQKSMTQLNKEKSRRFKELGKQTEKLADSTEKYIEEKIESQKTLVEHNRQMEAYNKQLACLEKNNWDKSKCPGPKGGNASSMAGLAQANAEADKKKAQPAAAPMEEQFMIAPQIGYAVYSNDEFDFETNIVAGLRFEAAVHPHFTFGASFSYTNMTITQEANLMNSYLGYPYYPTYYNNYNSSYNSLEGRELSYNRFEAELYGKFNIIANRKFKPYVGLGFGYARSTLDFKDREATTNFYQYDIVQYKKYVGQILFGSVMAGIDMQFTTHFGLNLDFKYSKAFNTSNGDEVDQTDLYATQYSNAHDTYFVESLGNAIDDSHRFTISLGANIYF